jgi:hypothetical protein
MAVWRIFLPDKMLPMLLLSVAGAAVIVLLYIKELRMLSGILGKRRQ